MTDSQSDDALNPAIPIEQGTLGCLLLGDPLPPDLREESFDDQRHKIIFETIALLHSEKVPDELILIETGNRLRLRGMLEGIGGIHYLGKTLLDAAPNKHNLDYWLPQLLELHGRRSLKQSLGDFIKGLDDPNASVESLIAISKKTLDYLSHSRNGHSDDLSARTPNEILAMTFDDSDCIMGDRLMAKGQNACICGPSSVGKSRLVLQQAVATITGRPFVGLETHGAGLKWLFLQAENSNRRYQFDLRQLRLWTGESDWHMVDKCLKLHTLETDYDGFLHLDTESHRLALARLIQSFTPDIIVFDSLYNFQIGDLNKDADMTATLLVLSKLCRTGNPERVPIVLHHALTGKAGAAKATGYDRASFGRNSKVLHAWTRGQINVSAGAPDNNERLVLSCGKCSNGREFPAFAVRLDPQTFIYHPDPDFDLQSWQSDISGTPQQTVMTATRVRELCVLAGSSKLDLVKAIVEDCFCSKPTAYRYVDSAFKASQISWSKSHQLYFRK